jgi:hypothetical protein
MRHDTTVDYRIMLQHIRIWLIRTCHLFYAAFACDSYEHGTVIGICNCRYKYAVAVLDSLFLYSSPKCKNSIRVQKVPHSQRGRIGLERVCAECQAVCIHIYIIAWNIRREFTLFPSINQRWALHFRNLHIPNSFPKTTFGNWMLLHFEVIRYMLYTYILMLQNSAFKRFYILDNVVSSTSDNHIGHHGVTGIALLFYLVFIPLLFM